MLGCFLILNAHLNQEKTRVYPDRGVFTLFSRVFYDHFPGNALRILASKRAKWKNAANTLIWRKYAQNTFISQMSIYDVFVLCDQVYTIWGTFCTIPFTRVICQMSQSKTDSGLSQQLFQNRPGLASFLSRKRIYHRDS